MSDLNIIQTKGFYNDNSTHQGGKFYSNQTINSFDSFSGSSSKDNHLFLPYQNTNHFDTNWLRELENIVLENLPEFGFTLERLSQLIYLSSRQVRRRLKQMTGMTFSQYLKEARLKEAHRLLERQEVRSVKRLAYKIGMRDVKYFSQQFKAHFGDSPSAYLA